MNANLYRLGGDPDAEVGRMPDGSRTNEPPRSRVVAMPAAKSAASKGKGRAVSKSKSAKQTGKAVRKGAVAKSAKSRADSSRAGRRASA